MFDILGNNSRLTREKGRNVHFIQTKPLSLSNSLFPFLILFFINLWPWNLHESFGSHKCPAFLAAFFFSATLAIDWFEFHSQYWILCFLKTIPKFINPLYLSLFLCLCSLHNIFRFEDFFHFSQLFPLHTKQQQQQQQTNKLLQLSQIISFLFLFLRKSNKNKARMEREEKGRQFWARAFWLNVCYCFVKSLNVKFSLNILNDSLCLNAKLQYFYVD